MKGRLAGNWLFDCWRLTPSAELAYISEDQDAFTNSAATLVPSQSVSLGRLTFGPGDRLSLPAHRAHGRRAVRLHQGSLGLRQPHVAIIDGFVVGPGDFWGRLEGGLMVVTEDGWQMRGAASYDGVGASDYSGYSLQGTLNVPLN